MTGPVVAWEVALLLRGLEWAYERCAEAHQTDYEVPDPVRAPLAAREFVGYGCALDEWLSEQKGTGYKSRRNQDVDGKLLIGLRFARDRHAHQATLTAVTMFTARYWVDAEGNESVPVLYPAAFTWRNLADVTEPNDGRETKDEYKKRRAAYEADLADRLALPTLKKAQRFLTAELRACGVD